MTQLWQHQSDAADWLARRKHGALLMEPGTGKTLTYLHTLIQINASLTLVICPLKIVPVWGAQIRQHLQGAFSYLELGEGMNGAAKAACIRTVGMLTEPQPHVVIINYEALLSREIFIAIDSVRWDAVCFDESHRLKNSQSKTWKNAMAICYRVPHRTILSGTPITNAPLDIWAQMRLLSPTILGKWFSDFRAQYAVMGGYKNREVTGYRDLDKLGQRVDEVAFRVRAAEVHDLPEQVDIVIPIMLPAKVRKLYDTLEREYVAQFADGQISVSNVLVKMLRLMQITSGFMKDDNDETHETYPGKYDALCSLFEELGPDEPVVVFSKFHENLDKVRTAALVSGKEVDEMSGRENTIGAKWEPHTHVYPTGQARQPHASVANVQIQSGAEGVDLTHAAYCVYFQVDFNNGKYEQSRKRVHRPGQTRPVFYYHLVATDTIDQVIYRSLAAKTSVAESIMAYLRERVAMLPENAS